MHPSMVSIELVTPWPSRDMRHEELPSIWSKLTGLSLHAFQQKYTWEEGLLAILHTINARSRSFCSSSVTLDSIADKTCYPDSAQLTQRSCECSDLLAFVTNDFHTLLTWD